MQVKKHPRLQGRSSAAATSLCCAWSELRFGPMTVKARGRSISGSGSGVPDDIDPDAVRDELYAGAQKDEDPITHALSCCERLVDADRSAVLGALAVAANKLPPFNYLTH
jgi:hypothetical protein